MPAQDTYRTISNDGVSGELCVQVGLKGLKELTELVSTGEVLAEGRHKVVRTVMNRDGAELEVAVKQFGRQSYLKDWSDRRRGSKACRSFLAAQRLYERGVGTPEPIGYIERWDGLRLKESYYLCKFESGLSDMSIELERIITEKPDCHLLVDLMMTAAKFIREMHDAGFQHRDLGVQNIMMRRDGEQSWTDLQVIDLNRGRIREALSLEERARDLDRLSIPGAFLEVLLGEYWQGAMPAEFPKLQKKAKAAYDRHASTRNLRKPKRWGQKMYWFQRFRDIWIWDERSAQASIIMSRKERKSCYPRERTWQLISAQLKHWLPAWKRYKALLPTAYSQSVELKGRIGMSLEGSDLDLEKQKVLLSRLGKIPVLIRFCHHESESQWRVNAQLVKELSESGHEVMLAILQDRRAVLEPGSWKQFLSLVLSLTAKYVNQVEVCHAVNRSKWGVWSATEQGKLLEPILELQKEYPQITFTGPACIDFEYYYVVTALDNLPKGLKLGALSHHLYVDRRGAPENMQGEFSLIEKVALLKAIAETNPYCGSEVIVSEVNWPVAGAGTWSPVEATYHPKWSKPSPLGVEDDLYGAYMLRYYAIALCSGMVEQVYWWRLVAHGFGLVDEQAGEQWVERSGYTMLVTFLSLLGESTFIEKLPSADQVYLLRFKTDQGEIVMGWANGIEQAVQIQSKRALSALGEELPSDRPLGDLPVYFLL